MNATVHAGAAAFLERARQFLQATVLENNALVGIVHRAVEQPERYPEGIWCVTLEEAGAVKGVATQTPPWPLLVSKLSAEGIVALAGVLRGRGLSGIVGPEETVRSLCRRIGASVKRELRHRFYTLREKPESPKVPGRLRPMTPGDRVIGLAWLHAFDREIGEPRTDEDRLRTINLGIATGQFFLWEDVAPVSMASRVETPPDGCRIGAVFTPPERRRRGYAGAIVAELSRRSFDEGRAWCSLYTDLANPTSNAIYQRIGYRPLLDVLKVEFDPAFRIDR